MVSIWKYTDGYYAVGEEGQPKTFLPSWEMVEDFLDMYHIPQPKLGSNNPKIRYANKAFMDVYKE